MASLAEIVKGVQETNQLLTDNVKAQERVQALLQNNADIAAAARMDALQDSKKTKVTVKGGTGKGRPKGFMGGLKAGMFAGGLEGWAISLIGSLFAAGGALFGAVTGAFGLALGTLVLPLATIALITAFGTGIITKLLEDLDPNNVVLDKETKASFANDVVKAMVIGIGLAIFSKPLGLAAFLGGIVVAAFKAGMPPAQREDFEKDILAGMGKKFGITFSKENMMQIGSIIAGIVSFRMIKKLITGAIFGTPAGDAKADPSKKSGRIMRFLRAGFALKFGAGMILQSIGEALGDAIGNITGSETLGDLVTGGVVGSSLALMLGLGAGGILTAAIVGVAFVAVKALSEWLNGRRQAVIDEALKDIDLALAGANKDMTPEALKQYFKSMSPEGFSALKTNLETAASATDVMNPDALTKTKRASEIFAAMNVPLGKGGVYAQRVANANLALGEKFTLGDAAKLISSHIMKKNMFGDGPLNAEQAKAMLNFMTTSAAMDTMPSAIQGNLRDFLANDANRAGILKLLVDAVPAAAAASAATIVDASSKSFSDHKSVHMLPATRPATVDTTTPQFIMMYGQRAMNPFGGM
jgi:hypothetical protein